jgi:hypothetical protein
LNGQPDLLQRVATPDGTIGRMVLTTGPIIFPGRETFLYEVYARHRFMGGPDAAYRALLAEQDAELGVRSHVVRWVHAEGDLVLGEGTELEGRASSSGTMWLGADVRFTRLRAVRVVAGRDERPAPAVPPVAGIHSRRGGPDGTARRNTRRDICGVRSCDAWPWCASGREHQGAREL